MHIMSVRGHELAARRLPWPPRRGAMLKPYQQEYAAILNLKRPGWSPPSVSRARIFGWAIPAIECQRCRHVSISLLRQMIAV